MYRLPTHGGEPPVPPLRQQMGAAGAIFITPAIGLLLGLFAWEHARILVASSPGATMFGASALTLGEVLSPIVAAAGALIAFHLTWTTALMLVTPRHSRIWASVASLTPAGWRRLVTIASAGVLSVTLTVPATAAVTNAAIESTDAGWVAAPVESTTEAPAQEPSAQQASATAGTNEASQGAEPAPGSSVADNTPPQATAKETSAVVVSPGDTLWDITATQLDLSASEHAAIAAAWPELYERNQDVIGSDPNVIVPDQQLALPEGWTA